MRAHGRQRKEYSKALLYFSEAELGLLKTGALGQNLNLQPTRHSQLLFEHSCFVGLCFFFPRSPVSLLTSNGSFCSRLQQRLREHAVREMGQLQHRICRLEAGGTAARARAGRPGIRKCVWGFPELPGARGLQVWFGKTVASGMTIYRKPNFALPHPSPQFLWDFFFLFYKESNVIYSLTMNHNNQYLFIVLHLQLNYSQHK